MSGENEAILAVARERIEELRAEARAMVDEHWVYYTEESRARPSFNDKSRLFPRLGKTKNGFAIEWYHIRKWFKDHDKKWKKVTRYVARGKSFRTNLTPHAQPWELERLKAFEDRAEIIRRQVSLFSDMIEGLDRLERLQETRREQE